MDASHVYEIVIEGRLSGQWSDWFDGLTVQNEPTGETRLTGLLCDQAALYGVLAKIHNLNLVLVSVLRMADPAIHSRQVQKGELTVQEW
jgi:hypothetical protein